MVRCGRGFIGCISPRQAIISLMPHKKSCGEDDTRKLEIWNHGARTTDYETSGANCFLSCPFEQKIIRYSRGQDAPELTRSIMRRMLPSLRLPVLDVFINVRSRGRRSST